MRKYDSIDLPNLFKCPKCGRKPVLKRSEDPSEIGKRYSTRCTYEGCKFKTPSYGNTKRAAAENWNLYVSRIAAGKSPSELRGGNGLT